MAKREVEDFIKEMAEAVSIRAFEDFISQVEGQKQSVESPIEHVLLAAMVAEHSLYALDAWWFMEPRKNLEEITKLREPGYQPTDGVFVWPQASVGRYRVDFLLTCHFWGQSKMFVVECDGHDHHERTKAQAAHDRSRDRWFTSQGFRVLRFTGSEIWADPTNCFAQISDAIENVFLFPERQVA